MKTALVAGARPQFIEAAAPGKTPAVWLAPAALSAGVTALRGPRAALPDFGALAPPGQAAGPGARPTPPGP